MWRSTQTEYAAGYGVCETHILRPAKKATKSSGSMWRNVVIPKICSTPGKYGDGGVNKDIAWMMYYRFIFKGIMYTQTIDLTSGSMYGFGAINYDERNSKNTKKLLKKLTKGEEEEIFILATIKDAVSDMIEKLVSGKTNLRPMVITSNEDLVGFVDKVHSNMQNERELEKSTLQDQHFAHMVLCSLQPMVTSKISEESALINCKVNHKLVELAETTEKIFKSYISLSCKYS